MPVLLPAPPFELSQAESQLLQFRAWLDENPYAKEQVATKRHITTGRR